MSPGIHPVPGGMLYIMVLSFPVSISRNGRPVEESPPSEMMPSTVRLRLSLREEDSGPGRKNSCAAAPEAPEKGKTRSMAHDIVLFIRKMRAMLKIQKRNKAAAAVRIFPSMTENTYPVVILPDTKSSAAVNR